MVFGALSFAFVVLGVSSYAISDYKASVYRSNREKAFHIAEAGINYYKWHLAHNTNDFTDGTGQPGPYVHEFQDREGNVIGYYSLNIIAPTSSTTATTIESTG